ncbi:hypothetical protein DFJ74DRAFT_686495 [Hyaloraphidium curvatum]|nr:hypothetical protein DFJ74DRAFT_686495 [Hyaloraphidium curvatum]
MWRLMSSCAKIDPFERPSFEGVVDYISLGDGADLSASSSAASAAAVGVSSAPSYSYSAAALAPNEASASSAHSALAPENAGGADGVPVDRIVLQVANGGYGQGDNPKNLPMASESVDLLRTVLVSFYGFSGSPLYDRDSTAIRTAARPACASLRGAQGTSIIHLVGHGGDRRGRFVFEGVSPGATDEGQPAEDSTVDLERDIMSQIPEDHQGLVVVLLDCCRGSMGTEDRPFDVDRNNVVLGLAARRDAKAYGCLYTFVLAEELWKRFDNQSGNLTWRDVLYDVEQRIIAGTAVVASHPQGTNPPATALVQQPRHSTLGTGEVKWHKFPLRPRAKTTNAKEYIQRKVLGNEFRNRAKDLENMDALQQSYPLASYMEDLFSGNYMLEMTFGDGRAWESRRSAWTAADLVLELCKTSASYRDSSVINARLRCLSGAAIKYGLGRLWLKEPHELVYGFVREAVVTNYRILHEAQFDLDVARPEVERKPDMTELTFAVICGRHKLVRALLQGPWELHEADKEGNTPFHHACRSGDMSMVQLFLDRFGTFDHTVRNVDGKQASDLVPSPAEMGSIKAALQFAETERGMKIAPASAFVVASNNLKGTGAFGATQEGTFNGHPAAIRTSPSKFGDDLLFHNQITIRNVIGEHENVMPILGFCEDPPMIAYPIGSNDLHCYFWYQRNHPGYWKAACRLLRDVAAGVAHCHAHSVVHGDLKPSNVIVFEDAGDFPVARVADFSGSILRYGHARSGADFKGIGTIPFQPPEMLAAGGNINQRAKESDDVYAFAMVCFEAATRGYEPFYGQRQDEIMRRVVAGERPEIPPDTPPLLATLMKECWHQDPEQRPSFEVIVHRMKEIVSEVS